MTSALLLLAHGSPDVRHTHAIAEITAAVGRAVDAPVSHAFLEHHSPDTAAAVGGLVGRGATSLVTVPLLLSAAYHRGVDVPRAVADGTAAFPGVRAVIGDVLAPDARLAASLDRRLREAGAPTDAAIVLATAGARGETAATQTADVAAALAALRSIEVRVAAPSELVEALQAQDGPAAVAAYLLAPGVIADRIGDVARAHGVVVSAPIGAAPELVAVVVDRYASALEGLESNAA